MRNGTGKNFNLCIGNTTVITISINTTIITSYSTQNIVTLSKGTYLVSMKMFGTNPDDYGIIVHTVNLQQMIPIPTQNITVTANYSIILPEVIPVIQTVNVMNIIIRKLLMKNFRS